MPHTVSARKRMRQNEKRRLANKSVKSEIKSAIKKVINKIAEGKKEEAARELHVAIKKIDRAAGKGIIHKNAAQREISRITLKFNDAFVEKGSAA